MQVKKILIIDDNDQIRWILCNFFQSEFDLFEACNGEEGLAKVEEIEPDFILCDVLMPKMDGIEFCKKMKQDARYSYIPIILLTSKTDKEDIILGLESGAEDYITKPFDLEILRSKMKLIMRRNDDIREEKNEQRFLRKKLNENEKKNSRGFIKNVMIKIKENIENPLFDAKLLAESLNMSLPTLYRRIKMYSEHSIFDLTSAIRLQKAVELIVKDQYSIQEISDMVGFNNVITFRKHFKKRFGMTPSQYIKNKMGS